MGFLGISLGGGWIGYLIAGFIGACILIAVARRVQRRGSANLKVGAGVENGDAGSGAQCAAPLAALGRHDDAVARYDRAIAARKNFVEVHQAKGERGLLLSRAKM